MNFSLSSCEIYYLLQKIANYEYMLFEKIKESFMYRFRTKKELQEAINRYCRRRVVVKDGIKYYREGYESEIIKYGNIALWDTSLITDMSYLFQRHIL